MINAKHINIKGIGRPNHLPTVREEKLSGDYKTLLGLTILHIPFGVLLYNTGSLGVLHPLAVFLFGIYLATRKQTKIEYVAYLVAYLIGVEVLWRMAGIPVFYEFGKYASALIMIAALVKRKLYKIPSLARIYFLMLIPACFLTAISLDASDTRAQLSFNMSGPFVLFIACWFFSNVQLTVLQVKRLLSIIIVPLVSVAFATLFYTVSNPNIEFDTESNFSTSGGFGPNQVSTLLGLGVFCAAACFLLFKNDTKYKLYFGLAALLLTAQSVMTFSRGGIYTAVGALLIVVLLQFQNFAEGLKRLIPIVVIAGLFLAFIFPVMNNFTGGKLLERFEETQGTNRAEIAESDVQVFLANPILGVGVGVGGTYRKQIINTGVASHTEFSRLLSEHGSLGLISLLSLAIMTVVNFKRQRSRFGRAFVGGVVVWASLYMLNAGMRLAAPGFIFGLSYVTFVSFQVRNKKRTNLNRQTPLQKRRLIADGVHSDDRIAETSFRDSAERS